MCLKRRKDERRKIEKESKELEMINKIIEGFNESFNTEIEDTKRSFLVSIYHNYIIEYYIPKIENEYLKDLVKIEDEIMDNMTKEEKKMFNQWNKIHECFWNEIVEEAFVLGYCTGVQLNNISV